MSAHPADELERAVEAAERWALFDPDPVTRGGIDQLVDRRAESLIELFTGRLSFGTAGLRAEVGAGPNRMNALVVRQTTAAVVDHLSAAGLVAPRVVIGFDARRDSSMFAEHAAAAVVAGGGTALLASDAAPTPVFAHALLEQSADAAIVITASHNPPADNGYKLYLGDGIQLVAPADDDIAGRIDALAARWFERGAAIDDAFAERAALAPVDVNDWIAAHRTAALSALFTGEREVSVVYTAMHGVGGAPVLAAFRSAGFAEPLVVAEQFEPDPGFPTVPFPNPEEPGAFDLALALAERHGVDAALANDPDADRLAIAVPSRSGDRFVPLSGNELGILLADHVLNHTTGTDRLVARSVVSSRQLDALAAAHEVHCEVTLTGFKWVARPIITHAPRRYVFGFEEAIGYCIGDRVRDKDGVTAALVAAEMLASLRAAGSTVWDRIDHLAARHGVYLNHPISLRFDDDPGRVHALMHDIAHAPPDRLGEATLADSGPVGLGALPPTPGLHLLTDDDTQVIIRPSGTEPKIKAYIEVVEHGGTDVAAARERAEARLARVVSAVQTLLGT